MYGDTKKMCYEFILNMISIWQQAKVIHIIVFVCYNDYVDATSRAGAINWAIWNI